MKWIFDFLFNRNVSDSDNTEIQVVNLSATVVFIFSFSSRWNTCQKNIYIKKVENQTDSLYQLCYFWLIESNGVG